jgi:urease accessory protein
MIRAVDRAQAGRWPADAAADSLTLAYDDRHRRRIRLVTDGGRDLLLDLPDAAVLGDGDGVRLEDGRWVRVNAAEEPVIEATAGTVRGLMRLAWHLGNRHTPAQLLADRIRIRDDHVLAAMLEGLGAEVERRREPFSPEAGAYAPAPARTHAHAAPADGGAADDDGRAHEH